MNRGEVIAISGASGFIGTELCKHFAGQNYRVIGLCRTVPVQKIQGVEYRPFDLETDLSENLFKDATIFIHCAYLKGENTKNFNIQGTKNLLNAARSAGVRKSIFFSSMSAHAVALSDYGQQKFELEKEFSGKDDAVIRPGLVIGNGGLFADMVRHIRTNKIVPLIDGGNQELYSVYISDVIKAIEIIIDKNLSGIYTVAELSPVLYRDFYKELARSINTKILMLPVPFWLIEKVFQLTEAFGIKLSVGRENLLGLKSPVKFDFAEDLKILGFQPMNYKKSFALFSAELLKK